MSAAAELERSPGALMAAELAEQPEALQRLLEEGASPIREIAERVAGRRPRFVLLAARRTSDPRSAVRQVPDRDHARTPSGIGLPFDADKESRIH